MLQASIETLRELLTQCLYEESVSHWYTADGFKSLFALIGTNGQGIGTRYALTVSVSVLCIHTRYVLTVSAYALGTSMY